MRKSVGAESDFTHVRLSEQHADSCVRLASYNFLLVFYNDLRCSVILVSNIILVLVLVYTHNCSLVLVILPILVLVLILFSKRDN